MRRQLTEDGALELLKDIESGEADAVGVQPADIAPDVSENDIADGIPYVASEDEEHSSNETTPLTEAKRMSYFRSLREARNNNQLIANFIRNTDDGSYEAFTQSPEYQQVRTTSGQPYDEKRYIDSIKYSIYWGKLSKDELPSGTPSLDKKSTYARSGEDIGTAAASSSPDAGGVYERGLDFDDTAPESDLVSQWENDYSEGQLVISDDEIFEDMAATVKEIIIGTADKRHALIAGDP